MSVAGAAWIGLVMLASPTADPRLVAARDALARADEAAFRASVSLCGDDGRIGAVRRVEAGIDRLGIEVGYRKKFWWWHSGSTCAQWGSYRRLLGEARLALAQADAIVAAVATSD